MFWILDVKLFYYLTVYLGIGIHFKNNVLTYLLSMKNETQMTRWHCPISSMDVISLWKCLLEVFLQLQMIVDT